MGTTMEAMLSYWLSQFVLPIGLEDGINFYVFPMVICLAKGEKLALGLYTSIANAGRIFTQYTPFHLQVGRCYTC